MPLLLLMAALLAGCTTPESRPQPMLVTLPANPGGAGTFPTATPVPITPSPAPTPTLTPPLPPTPDPAQGLDQAVLLWQWGETARPAAAAASETARWLAVLAANGRFYWLEIDTGRQVAADYVWEDALRGDSWGQISADGTLAALALREASLDPQTGLAASRARLAVIDGEANVLWALPELGSQHFYSTTLTTNLVIAGKWPYGFPENSLAAYEVFTGEPVWQADNPEGAGYHAVIDSGSDLYAVLSTAEGGALASFDLQTGEERWRWPVPGGALPYDLTLHEGSLFMFAGSQVIALDSVSGQPQWQVDFQAAPEAGFSLLGGLIYLVPAPGGEAGTRPGLAALAAADGAPVWGAQQGLVVDALAAGEGGLWVITKDYDTGEVDLMGLEPTSGEIQVLFRLGSDPYVLYSLEASGRRVFVLGESLSAYGY